MNCLRHYLSLQKCLNSISSWHIHSLQQPIFCRTYTWQHADDQKYIPRRAVLFVPGSDDRKIQKIPSLTADCIVLDCEDGVALSKKDFARKNIYDVLNSKSLSFCNKDCSVRVNSIESELCEDDLKVILSGEVLPDTVHLPKVDSEEQIAWFSDKVCKILDNRSLSRKLRLIIFTESARSLMNLDRICQTAVKLSERAPFLLDGIVFGGEDYCADTGITRTEETTELTFARQMVVTVAKANRLQAVDIVYINYKDLDGLRRQSDEGARFGFTGKQVIHPGQVEIVQVAFSPSDAKVKWAKDLIRAFEQHQQEGKGAFTFHGSMIDMPLLRQALNIVRLSESVGT